MRIVAADIGSTFTKASVLDLAMGEVLASVAVATGDDISTGLQQTFDLACSKVGTIDARLACCSAAGGLTLIACGLVPELTVEAARRAALGAGGRVLSGYGYELTRSEVEEIKQKSPDMILLAGGTDGGNRQTIVANATKLAEAKIDCPVIVAGNKSAADDVGAVFEQAEITYRISPNVMPRLYELNVEPVREVIRQLFLQQIINARGLNRVQQMIDGPLIPTPLAVQQAAELYAGDDDRGVMVIDIGGATTDVYSIATGISDNDDVTVRGLKEPVSKRTVEGDLGIRVSARALVEVCGCDKMARLAGVSSKDVSRWVAEITAEPDRLMRSDAEGRIDRALARCAVELAVERHVGYLEQVRTAAGMSLFQYGKDLQGVSKLVCTGGAFVYGENVGEIARGALFNDSKPHVLKPLSPELLVDKDYVLAKIGLVAERERDAASKLLVSSLVSLRGSHDEI